MKQVFLDLGTHYGEGLRDFIQRFHMNESWEIHTFEANPFSYNIFMDSFHHKTPWVIAHNQAISNYDGQINVNIESPPGEGETGMGTSVIGLDEWNPWNGTIRENFQHNLFVPCVDLSGFILRTYQPSDHLVIKMDIEGAEYDTLDQMIATGAISYVKFLAVEWHSRFFTNAGEMHNREQRIMDHLRERNIQFESWH